MGFRAKVVYQKKFIFITGISLYLDIYNYSWYTIRGKAPTTRVIVPVDGSLIFYLEFVSFS